MFDHFGIIAPFYDRAMPFSRMQQMLEHVSLPVDGVLLDAGGGTGRVAIALKPYLSRVFVVDFSHKMLLQAFSKGLPGAQAPAEKLPFPDNCFDRIIMVDALHHVHDQKCTLSELWRVLKIGGILVIEEPDVRAWQVKLLALVEKILLMRSHFWTPLKILEQLPQSSKGRIVTEGYNAWVIINK